MKSIKLTLRVIAPAFLLAGALFPQLTSAAGLPNAWQVNDNSDADSLGYITVLASGVRTVATNAGFDFSVNARLVSDYGTGVTDMGMIYGDGRRRWEVLWFLDSNGDLFSAVFTNISPSQVQFFQVTSNGTGRALYHTHEIIFTNGSASYVVDGHVVKSNWAGAADTGWTAGQVFWGSVSSAKVGEMNFHNISFVVTNGIVAGYDAGTEPTNAPHPSTRGWTLNPSAPPSGTSTNAISPDRGQGVITTLANSGYGSLRQAIADASPGDTISFFTNGVITLTSQLVITTNLAIVGPGPANLAISGDNNRRAFYVQDGVVSISGLTIENGHGPDATTDGGDGGHGGAIYNSGSLTLSNCVVADSVAGDGGDGSDGADGTIGNKDGGPGGDGGNGGHGGGIYNGNSLTLLACVLTNNAAGKGGKGGKGGDGHGGNFFVGDGGNGGSGQRGGNGGGIYNNGILVCSNCFLSWNIAGNGGAGGVGGDGGAGSSDSYGDGGVGGDGGNAGRGGLAYNAASADGLAVIDCAFNVNRSGRFGAGGLGGYNAYTGERVSGGGPGTEGYGGAIANYQAALATISGSTFFDNSAPSGSSTDHPSYGGVIYSANNSGTFALANCTFFDNSATHGGVIYNADSGGTFMLNNCTLCGNDAPNGVGGGIDNNGGASLLLTNTIVAGNTADTSPNVHGSYSGTNNLLMSKIPLLAPLGDYGGPTLTMPPLDGSPVLDAGTDSSTNLLATDQRGFLRLSGAHIDLGAAEAQQSAVLNANDNGAGSLRATIAAGPELVTFANNLAGQTIHLTSGELILTNNLGIDASSLAGGLTIEAGGNSRIIEISSNSSVILTSLTLANGNAVDNGGGILVDGSAELTINKATLDGNTAGYGGGAIMVQPGGSLTVNNSTLSGNSVPALGGGIYNNGRVTLNNSTVAGNSASALGGGIYNNGTLTLKNSTISGNSVPVAGGAGGGIYDISTMRLTNTIVAGNTASTSSNIFGTFSGTKNITSGIPLLAQLGDYGGPTATMPPLAGSPAIDTGLDSITSALPTDQRGYPRRSGPHVDVGAAEAQSAPSTNPPPVLENLAVQANGAFQFSFTNIPNADFTVMAATNVDLPFSQWTPLGLAVQSASSQYQFTDPAATNYPQRFYRVRSP